jgi:hypothetical protein
VSENISQTNYLSFVLWFLQGHTQGVMSLSRGLLLVAMILAASLATMAVILNPTFAGTGFKNKAECIELL